MTTLTKIHSVSFPISLQDLLGLGILSIIIGCGSYILGQTVLQDFPNSADEFAFLFQAQLFTAGKISVPAHPQQEFLNPFHIITHQNQVFTIYPPGWPSLLSLGIRWGNPGIINPLIGAAAVPVLYYLIGKLSGRIYAWLAVLFLVLSPAFWFNNASYFSHPTCLLLILLTSIFLVLTLEAESVVGNEKIILRIFFPFLAGFSFACAYGTREMTSLILLCLPVLYAAWKPTSSRQGYFKYIFFLNWRFIGLFLLGAIPLLFGYLWYNAELTGRWFFPPRYLLHDEYVGFGAREYRLFDYAETRYFGPLDGLRNTIRNLGRLLIWTFPGLPLLALWGVLTAGRQLRNPWLMVFSLSALLLPTAYFFYHSDGDNQYGPRYYYETLGYMIFQAAVAAAPRIKIGFCRSNRIKWVCLGVLLLCLDGCFFWRHAAFFQHQIFQRRTLYRLVEHQALRHALVFVGAPSGDMTQGDLIRNSPDPEKSEVIYAWDLAQRNRELPPYFPDRRVFLFTQDSQTGTYFLQPLSPRLGVR